MPVLKCFQRKSWLVKRKCVLCGWTHTSTSAQVDLSSTAAHRGRRLLDVNVKTHFALREIPKGYAALQRICGFVNMPKPMSKGAYDTHFSTVYEAYTSMPEKRMKTAAADSLASKSQRYSEVEIS